MSVGIGALITLRRIGFARSSRLGFYRVLLLVIEHIDLMRESVESFAISGEVRGISMLQKKSANINITERVRRLNVVNHSIYGRGKRLEKVAPLSFIAV